MLPPPDTNRRDRPRHKRVEFQPIYHDATANRATGHKLATGQ